MTREQKLAAIRAILDAIVEGVKAGGSMGTPGGVLYAALLDKINLSQFEAIMAALVQSGRLRRQGERYFAAN